MATEIWKDIEGLDGKYQVSNLGRIKAKEYPFTHIWCGKEKTSIRKERILKQCLDSCGYLHLGLQVSQGVQKRFSSHRLVYDNSF